jgi:hypothetical protein
MRYAKSSLKGGEESFLAAVAVVVVLGIRETRQGRERDSASLNSANYGDAIYGLIVINT